ncbi:STAS domain-containing protein [Actinokineospora diospyrosa]|uniref:STAS domain-containing protein n=1 Tax=Actinokineospora diospyrosa TaxID=103728 RepID=A0ABT1I7A9_9PSEU|nr:STAS domain-containing protein [Actinokineospora diospyrosa]MCP2268513.1 STAS domain-containing protein [Actinokineospora diospyrosa]
MAAITDHAVPPRTDRQATRDGVLPRQGGSTRLSGHADLRSRPDFEQLLVALCRQATGDVHLDLAELDFIDVSGVITLLRVADTLPGSSRLVLRNPPESMRRILELLGPAVAAAGVVVERTGLVEPGPV